MFHANKGYKLEIVVLISTSPFAKQAFSGDTLFKRYFHENKALHTQNESLQHRLSNEMRQMATFSVFKVQFFQRVFFFIFYFLFLFFFGAGGGEEGDTFFSPVQGPDLGPVFKTIPSVGTVGIRSALLLL